jgi:exosortase A-associated hydrolase 1
MEALESPVSFEVDGERCTGILHAVSRAASTGVLVIVGGPQYRVGSHRQFVLLARALAAAGTPALRFDYRGLGDSEGAARDFTAIDQDIRAAIDCLVAHTGVANVVLWGLCDAASAALMAAPLDARVRGLVLLNPWVHTEAAEAQVRLKQYYLQRLMSRDLWRKVLRLEFDWRASLHSLLGYVGAARSTTRDADGAALHFIERMRRGWAAFEQPVLLILSGNDFTAAEFRQLIEQDAGWRQMLADKPFETVELVEANHTFARAEWRDAVARATIDWLAEQGGDTPA